MELFPETETLVRRCHLGADLWITGGEVICFTRGIFELLVSL